MSTQVACDTLPDRVVGDVHGAPIDVIDWNTALDRIFTWAEAGESRYVCICNVHSIITACGDPEFRRIVTESDLNTPDGAPVAWMLRRDGFIGQQRINGPDLMWRYAELAAHTGQPMYFYGGLDVTLEKLRNSLLEAFPNLLIAGMYSPPFRQMTQEEDEAAVARINASGARVVWVGLGCPKQERWMATHRGRIQAVMVGVGAAFSYHAGELRRAPEPMRNAGLEWFFRLIFEPRRLARRYFATNSRFIGLSARWMLGRMMRRALRSRTEVSK